MIRSTQAILLAAAVLCAATPFASVATAGEKLRFNRDVRPILSEACFRCHGFDPHARKADLRLDLRDEATRTRDDAQPVAPGHPEASEVIRRITSSDPDEMMPPPKSRLTLTATQIATIKQWIAEGAEYETHWAFIPPVEPALPQINRAARNPIDHFVLSRLEREGLAPSPAAERHTLIRRVTFDLTGLPPTPAEVAAFVANPAADAYEQLVDRLLASPHYGERMVVDWLDAARYADTNGYQGDPTRTMWPWRDWVIRAFNDNMPFNQFMVEQIAGDLLPNASATQRLASGFNRNHSYNGEGGRIAEETRVENVTDRVDTMATTFLGLTVGCAKCHDHKYDPVTQKEYYQFYAYFNQCSETGQHPGNSGNAAPTMSVASPQVEQRLVELRAALATAEAARNAALPQIDAVQTAWEATVSGETRWQVVAPLAMTSQHEATFNKQADDSVLLAGPSPLTDVHEVLLAIDLPSVTGFKLEALPDASLPQGGPGRSEDSGNFVLTNLEVDVVGAGDNASSRRIAVGSASATYSQPGFSASGAIDDNPSSGWAVWKAPDKNNLSATFLFAEPIASAPDTRLRLRFHYESQHRQHSMGRFRLSLTADAIVPNEVRAAIARPASERDEAQRKLIREHYRGSVSPSFPALEAAVASARKSVEEVDRGRIQVMVMDDAQPRETHILVRGQYDKKADAVTPGTPVALHRLPEDSSEAAATPNNRLRLAHWLADPKNPLTARVIVNRYWQMFFGTGLVKTSDDFGTQGDPPSHPELLEWLAYRFVADGWNVKAMHRLIVTSDTYRQSSKLTPLLAERDPANRLLARGPRYRLSSFALRDQALAASGLLIDKLGGTPVRPYQPSGVWEEMSLGQIGYTADKGEALYRRSVYTFWRRTVSPTTMFDVPGRTVCSVRPMLTNTPLQALALMNDVTYIEAARVLAELLLRRASAVADAGAIANTTAAADAAANNAAQRDSATIDEVYLRFMARRANDAEKQILIGRLDRLRGAFQADAAGAQQLVDQGEHPRDKSLPVAELAAWTALVNLIMNLDETITKE